MQGFIKLAEGIDVLPLKMAVERQLSVFGDRHAAALFSDGDWQGEFFAFPQVRVVLLDIMRRVECGKLIAVQLLQMAPTAGPVGPLENGQECFVLLALNDCLLHGQGLLRAGDVIWANGDAILQFQAGDEGGFALVVTFEPIP